MSSALNRLITLALQSDDPNLRVAAKAAQAEHDRGRGRPTKLSADDREALFIVFDGFYGRHYTGEVAIVGGEPVAITEPSIDATEAISRELMAYAHCSKTTAQEFAREQLKTMAANLEAELGASGVRINMRDAKTKERSSALKAAKKNLTNK